MKQKQKERQNQQVGDRIWHVETHAIDPISDRERHGHPRELFPVWFASNVTYFYLIYGTIVFASALSLAQATVVTVSAMVVSFGLVAILSFAGVSSGAPMLTASRATFGPRGNLGPILVSWLNLLGWEIVGVVFASYALLDGLALVGMPVTGFLPRAVCLVVVLLLVAVLGVLGHATIVVVQFGATVVFGLLSLVAGVLLLPHVNWSLILAIPSGPWDTGVLATFSIIAAATGFTWINTGADYTRYLPRSTQARAIIGWTISGAALPGVLLILLGFLLSSSVRDLATSSDPVAVIRAALPPWMALPYILSAAGGLLAAIVLGLYSSSLSLLSGLTPLGISWRRTRTIWIDVLVMLVGAFVLLFISQSFINVFESFLQLITVLLMAWGAVFLVDMLRRPKYDTAGLADVSPRSCYFYWRGVNPAALVIWLVGIVVGLAFTSSPLFTGPLAVGIFASSGLGYLLGFLVSGALYMLAIVLGFVPPAHPATPTGEEEFVDKEVSQR